MKRISNTQQKIANRSMNQSIYSLKYSDHLFTIFSSLELMEILKSLLSINPNWHELRKQEKCSSLARRRSKFYKTQRAWEGVKLTRLMSKKFENF